MYFDQQQFCVVCVDGLGYVYESYVVLVCAYGGVVGYLRCLDFCVSFVSCIVMMSGWVLCNRFFSSSILFPMLFILI